MNRLRALVANSLSKMSQRIEDRFGPILAGARQAWDEVDNHALIDGPLDATIDGVRRTLQAAADGAGPVAGVALEGLLALETARSLVALAERRLSSLIRLRVRQSEELLPGGRPFLDLGPALAEAARAWA